MSTPILKIFSKRWRGTQGGWWCCIKEIKSIPFLENYYIFFKRWRHVVFLVMTWGIRAPSRERETQPESVRFKIIHGDNIRLESFFEDSLMIHNLFVIHESFYKDEKIKCNIILIVLKRENISNIYINVDKKYLWHMY